MAEETVRPRYALEGHEDEIYHELRVGERANEPEYCAFLDKSWVFNRALRWVNARNGTLLCYAATRDLMLTGVTQVSEWFSDPANHIEQIAGETRFTKASGRRRDCIALPALQFNIDQHPTLELEVSDADTDWQFCVLVKGRSGPPLLASEWQRGAATLTFDLAGELQRRGYSLHFYELHFVVGLWTEGLAAPASVQFSLRLTGRGGVVPCLPVIRAASTAARDGVPLSALVVDRSGRLRGSKVVSVRAKIGNTEIPLQEQRGVWTGVIPGLPEGEHQGELMAEGAINAHTDFVVRVTDGRFLTYDRARRSLARAGSALGPLTGSYHGMVYFANVGEAGERIVQGQEAWDGWDRAQPPGEHWHYWEALTEAELEERFSYLERCGWNLTHICQHWGIWEKLDGGGRIAPHGAEQVALFLRVAARHRLAVLQALSHYHYGGKYTPPVRQYFEAGFRDGDWLEPKSVFTRRLRGYLHDYATLFREETALFAMSTSGEGDHVAKPRVDHASRYVTSLDKNHIFLSEPIIRLTALPQEMSKGWKQQIFGSRMYWMGEYLPPEIDLGVEFKLLQLGDYFMAEGSWPCPPLHARFVNIASTWAGTPEYRTRVRDSLYLGLVHRSFIMLTWDEQQTEDEHIILNQVRQLVDWQQPFQEAPVAVRIDGSNVGSWEEPTREGRSRLAKYEEWFSAQPLATRYLAPNDPVPPTAQAVLDARQPYQDPRFGNGPGSLPESLRGMMPLQLSPGYRASYLWSRDRRTLLAYIYNSTNHEEREWRTLSGTLHRVPRPTRLDVRVSHLPSVGLRWRLFDLNHKVCLEKVSVTGAHRSNLGETDRDYLLLATPEP